MMNQASIAILLALVAISALAIGLILGGIWTNRILRRNGYAICRRLSPEDNKNKYFVLFLGNSKVPDTTQRGILRNENAIIWTKQLF